MELKYPELSDRIQSSFIDLLLLVVMMFIFASVLDRFENAPEWVTMVMFVSLFIIYEPLFQTFGCTAGNYVKGIRVRKSANPAKKINFLQALIRYPVKFLLGWVSFLTIGADPKRRAIHDMVAGSVMLKV